MDEGGTWSSRPDRGLGLGANRPIMGRRRRGGGPARCVRRRAPASASSGLGLHGESSHSWAGLGWAALDWIGLDWIGWTGGMHARVRVYWREREERAGHAGSRGRVGSGQVRSGRQQGSRQGHQQQAGWLAGWRRAGRFAGRFSGRPPPPHEHFDAFQLD